jgi:hypothetical protein
MLFGAVGTERVVNMIIPICEHCKNSFANVVPVTVIRDGLLSLFCSIRCRDKWLYFGAIDTWLEERREAFNPRASSYNRNV